MGDAGTDSSTFGGGLDFSGNAALALQGTIATTNDDVLFGTGGVTLVAASAVTTAGGAITFEGLLNGGQNLTITAGTGNVTFTGAVGGTTRLGTVTLVSSNDVNAGNFSATNTTFEANGSIQSGAYNVDNSLSFTADKNIGAITVTANSALLKAKQNISGASIIASHVSVQGGNGILLTNTTAGGFSGSSAFQGLTLLEPFSNNGSYTVNGVPFGPSREAQSNLISQATASTQSGGVELALLFESQTEAVSELDQVFSSSATQAPYVFVVGENMPALFETSNDLELK